MTPVEGWSGGWTSFFVKHIFTKPHNRRHPTRTVQCPTLARCPCSTSRTCFISSDSSPRIGQTGPSSEKPLMHAFRASGLHCTDPGTHGAGSSHAHAARGGTEPRECFQPRCGLGTPLGRAVCVEALVGLRSEPMDLVGGDVTWTNSGIGGWGERSCLIQATSHMENSGCSSVHPCFH